MAAACLRDRATVARKWFGEERFVGRLGVSQWWVGGSVVWGDVFVSFRFVSVGWSVRSSGGGGGLASLGEGSFVFL